MQNNSFSIKSVGFIVKDSTSAKALESQVFKELQSCGASVSSFDLLKPLKDLVSSAHKHQKVCDAIFIDSIEGIVDENGTSLGGQQFIDIWLKGVNKPVIGANMYYVKSGALCAVLKTGQEQGTTVAEMLLKALQGTPVADIPAARNYQGKRSLNVTSQEALGITPRPVVLLVSELVKTEEQ